MAKSCVLMKHCSIIIIIIIIMFSSVAKHCQTVRPRYWLFLAVGVNILYFETAVTPI